MFGNVNLTKTSDPDKYSYSGCGIGFDPRSEFSLPRGSIGENFIIFGVDMSSSVHIDNAGKAILVFRKGPTPGLDDTMLKAEAQYSINFSGSNKNFCLSLKQLCLGSIQKYFLVNKMKKTGLNGWVHNFSFDHVILMIEKVIHIKSGMINVDASAKDIIYVK